MKQYKNIFVRLTDRKDLEFSDATFKELDSGWIRITSEEDGNVSINSNHIMYIAYVENTKNETDLGI